MISIILCNQKISYLVRLFSCMYSFMVHFLLIRHKFSVAKFTIIAAISSMSSFMLISYVFPTKRFPTNCAQKRPRGTVSMTFEGIAPSKGHTTLLTLEWTHSRMNNTFMESHRCSAREKLSTI